MNLVEGSLIEFRKIATLSREKLKAYSVASGDPNLIHLDDNEAKKVGLPGVIAHGMLIASYTSERALQFLEEFMNDDWKLSKFTTRFKSMTAPEDTISVGGSIKSVNADEIEIELKAQNQDFEIKVLAKALFKIKD
ncbi:MAG: hypothetical protein CL678_17995 [Bdellovibrionaceae bacterium]|nr:hypothetical protein [Pseudobdellovibrionaceae bacterium]|tara:strand:- start:177 stop:584 length:408 start_codon:yes stop_codon:yes gene_type:complete